MFLLYLVNGGWGPYGPWSTCDTQTGTKERVRLCDNPRPVNDGFDCVGGHKETENCPGIFLT